MGTTDAAVDLYWLPLGAGGHSVRFNGLIFEAISAWARHRPRRDLYHSALEVTLGADRYTIEMAPVWNDRSPCRGVVAEGAVGARRLGRLRAFRYEIRCWRDGRIPDIDEAVDSPRRLTGDAECARRILGLAPQVPTAVWGRDELHTGDMWNSNSVISWLIARAEIDIDHVDPPMHGRAPGWTAGRVVAQRAGVARSPVTLASWPPSGRHTQRWSSPLRGQEVPETATAVGSRPRCAPAAA